MSGARALSTSVHSQRDGESMKYRTVGAIAISLAWGVHAHAQEAKVDVDAKVKVDARKEAAPPAASSADLSQAPQRPPLYGKRGDWFIEPYGYARLDAIEDSTQSFEDGIQPNLIARVGTYKGDHRRSIFTAKDSRLGVF